MRNPYISLGVVFFSLQAESSWMSRAEELEVICLKLQHQVWEMEVRLMGERDYYYFSMNLSLISIHSMGGYWVGREQEPLNHPTSHHGSRQKWEGGESLFCLFFYSLTQGDNEKRGK